MEDDVSSERFEEDVIEDLEVKKLNKRYHSVLNDDEKDDDGFQKKKLKFTSEKEMKRLSKPATAEELNRLRETENLFHSNLFRLQIEEMLKEIQCKEKYKKEFKTWFDKFCSFIMKMKDGQKCTLTDRRWLKELKFKVPIPQCSQCDKGVYWFKKPSSIEIIGSYHLGTLVGPKIMIDLAVVIPQKFFQKEDFINGIYHYKRALYMCNLLSYIQKLEIIEDVNFVSAGVDVLKPNIEIKPSGKLGKNVTVLLYVIPDAKKISLSQFNPDKNNVMKQWFFKQDVKVSDGNDEATATPFYNSTILSDLTLMENNKFLFNSLESYKNIREGVMLLKVWLRQRELTSGLGDFNGYLVAMLVAYLLQLRKISTFMSSYQVIRAVFNFLVSSDWTNKGITLSKKTNDKNVPAFGQFHNHHKVVFIDVTGHYNMCYGMHSSIYQQVQAEAQIALRALDDPNANSFQILFMTPVPFYRHFDNLFVFHNDEALQNTVEIYGSQEDRLNFFGTPYPHLISMIYDILKQGLRGRIDCLRIRQPKKNRWKPHKKFHYSLNVTFGLNFNPDHYYSVVDKAGEGETFAFRDFWGALSELRRFQDGNITEAVIWNAQLFSEKRLICMQIIHYLMKSKFGLNSSDFKYLADQFDCFIDRDLEESSMKVVDVFLKLSKDLRNLKNLPLDIVSVQGASPVCRYTELTPLTCKIASGKKSKLSNGELKGKSSVYEMMDPVINFSPPFVNPVQVVVQMGATNKWPQDLAAIHRLRTAFYIKIAQALTSQCSLKAVSFTDKVEIQKEGYVFHMKIFCPNEIGLAKRIVEDGLVKYRDNELSIELEKQMVYLPKLSNALHGLYEQHSSFGPACCLVKRWINSQMIDSFHISEEVLEMLVASLYLKPMPHLLPQQPQVAFFRFLYVMATTDWNSEYIVLNFNDELNREDLLELESHFTANRSDLPALFIATPYDRKKSIWTKDCPTPLILLRLIQLCGNVLDFIEKRLYENVILSNEFKILFEPSMEPYDIIINLHKNHIPRINNYSERNGIESVAETKGPMPVNGFDPVSIYVKELRESYDDVALFFYNRYGGSVVGVVWKPDAVDPRDFKVQNMAMRTLDNNTNKLHLTKELIIEDFLIIGKGLVMSVDVREKGSTRSYTFL